jgi:hypothetical protein
MTSTTMQQQPKWDGPNDAYENSDSIYKTESIHISHYWDVYAPPPKESMKAHFAFLRPIRGKIDFGRMRRISIETHSIQNKNTQTLSSSKMQRKYLRISKHDNHDIYRTKYLIDVSKCEIVSTFPDEKKVVYKTYENGQEHYGSFLFDDYDDDEVDKFQEAMTQAALNGTEGGGVNGSISGCTSQSHSRSSSSADEVEYARSLLQAKSIETQTSTDSRSTIASLVLKEEEENKRIQEVCGMSLENPPSPLSQDDDDMKDEDDEKKDTFEESPLSKAPHPSGKKTRNHRRHKSNNIGYDKTLQSAPQESAITHTPARKKSRNHRRNKSYGNSNNKDNDKILKSPGSPSHSAVSTSPESAPTDTPTRHKSRLHGGNNKNDIVDDKTPKSPGRKGANSTTRVSASTSRSNNTTVNVAPNVAPVPSSVPSSADARVSTTTPTSEPSSSTTTSSDSKNCCQKSFQCIFKTFANINGIIGIIIGSLLLVYSIILSISYTSGTILAITIVINVYAGSIILTNIIGMIITNTNEKQCFVSMGVCLIWMNIFVASILFLMHCSMISFLAIENGIIFEFLHDNHEMLLLTDDDVDLLNAHVPLIYIVLLVAALAEFMRFLILLKLKRNVISKRERDEANQNDSELSEPLLP